MAVGVTGECVSGVVEAKEPVGDIRGKPAAGNTGLCPGGEGEAQSLGVCGSVCRLVRGEWDPDGSFAPPGGGVPGVDAGGGEEVL